MGENFPYASPLEVAVRAKGDTFYVALHTGRSVAAFDMASGRTLWVSPLQTAVSGLVIDEGRGLLYVAHGLENGRISALKMSDGALAFDFPAGHTPSSPLLSADAQTLFVCNRFDNEVVAYDLQRRAATASFPVAREPVAAVLTPDGATLVVAQHLPAQPATARMVAAAVDIVDTATFGNTTSVLLPIGSTGVHAMSISADGKFAYVTHTLGRFHLPTTQLDRGWMNTNAFSIIDIDGRNLLATVLLDDVDRGAANPWGIACSADGNLLVVAHSGTHELSVIDRRALHAKIERIAEGQASSSGATRLMDIANDLTFLVDIRERIQLPGMGPRGLAMTQDAVIVAEYFSDSLAILPLPLERPYAIRRIGGVQDADALNEVRRGQIAFYDAKRCFQGWQSCASCHPATRTDALNWDLLNDGIGNPKNTRTMLHSHATPPVMITGIRPSAEVAVRAGFRFIQFTQVPEGVAAAVDAYLSAMKPVPSPWLVEGELSPVAQRGYERFQQLRCVDCHSGPYYTNGKKYDVGTGPDELGIAEFVTPSLSEVWRTAPYLFDGRAATMEEVFREHNPADRHGATSALSETELAELIEYVLSL